MLLTSRLPPFNGFKSYLYIKNLPTGPPKSPPVISPSVAAAIPIAHAFSIPRDSIVFPNASEYPCPPSIDTDPHINPRSGLICRSFDENTAIKF